VLYSARSTCIYSDIFRCSLSCFPSPSLVVYSAHSKTYICSDIFRCSLSCSPSPSTTCTTCIYSDIFRCSLSCFLTASLVVYSARSKTCIFSDIALQSILFSENFSLSSSLKRAHLHFAPFNPFLPQHQHTAETFCSKKGRPIVK